MKRLKEFTHDAALAILFGALIMVGMRAIEWAIPAPPQKHIYCVTTDFTGDCKPSDPETKAREA